ncbi:MAG: methylisocitrate lyase [Chloroflexi bacterium]|nr:methylisocitrate lyase [Chloroflexota bacterium]MCL5108872.1 methylisocitrate lyase [Chloroflexota bacterium]
MATTQVLRRLLAQEEILVAPGACDALVARLIEQAGFTVVYMTGAGTANGILGLPDIGLTTLTEMATNARHICDAISLPVIADADTGFGNALNVMRAVREYEQAGLAGLHIEDQVAPKRCGHVAGKECVALEEMVGKVQAAVAARRDPDFVIIARTDARAPLGFDEAVKRGRAYAAAGADLIFPEALESREELAEYARAVHVPLMANMTEFGKTPYFSAREFQEAGYSVVIYPMSACRVALKAMQDFLRDLKQTGTQTAWLPRMLTRRDLYSLLDYSSYTEHERRYLGEGVEPLE